MCQKVQILVHGVSGYWVQEAYDGVFGYWVQAVNVQIGSGSLGPAQEIPSNRDHETRLRSHMHCYVNLSEAGLLVAEKFEHNSRF